MIRLFKHYVQHAVLLLGLAEFALLAACAEAGWRLAGPGPVDGGRAAALLAFAASWQAMLVAVGAYGPHGLRSVRFGTTRLLVSGALAFPLLALLSVPWPAAMPSWPAALGASVLAVAALALLRLLFGELVGSHLFRRRILVLGAGHRAERIRDLAKLPGASFVAAGYVAMAAEAPRIPSAIRRAAIDDLAEYVLNMNVREIVLALDERRNTLPMADLLRVKTTGVEVNELSSFLERETGRVDLASVNPSWLVFSDGFLAGRRLSAVLKRLFDVAASLVLLVLAAPIIGVTAVLIRLESPGPAFYRQHRVGLYGEEFPIVKLRSMRQDAEADGRAVWARRGDARVTRIGRVIRKLRIDELPQAWTVLSGRMSFVGPRPERRPFVAELEEKLPYYAVRHMVKPGITGWAQINYPYGASLEDARHKLEYDLYYVKNYTPFLDVLILLQTVRVLLWNDGAR